MKHTYKNKYGQLEIEIVGSFQDVSKMNSKEFDPGYSFSIDDAEKIALITDNNSIQIIFPMWDRKKVFMVYHVSPSLAALCRVIRMDFDTDVDAREVLAGPAVFITCRPWYNA